MIDNLFLTNQPTLYNTIHYIFIVPHLGHTFLQNPSCYINGWWASRATSSAGFDFHYSCHKFAQGSKLYILQMIYYNRHGQSSKICTTQHSQRSRLVLAPKWRGSLYNLRVFNTVEGYFSALYADCPSSALRIDNSWAFVSTLHVENSFFCNLHCSVLLILGPDFTLIDPWLDWSILDPNKLHVIIMDINVLSVTITYIRFYEHARNILLRT